jgi:hypothetical protein
MLGRVVKIAARGTAGHWSPDQGHGKEELVPAMILCITSVETRT